MYPRPVVQMPASGEVSLNGDDSRSLDEVEKEHILKILRRTGGNYGETCKILGISRPTLRKKIADYGLKDYIES